MLEDIKTYRKISNNLHIAAQPTTEQFKLLKKAGVDLVINLALSDSPGAIKQEADVVQECAMVYIHIPVDFKKPEITDLEHFFQIMDQSKDKNVLVHCAYNWRVSSFVFLYRVIKQGCDQEIARQAMLEIWEPDETWQAFIDASLENKNSFL